MRTADRPGLPYHRVIAAGGRLGGYSSLSLKRSLLSAEGLTVDAGTGGRILASPLARRRIAEAPEVAVRRKRPKIKTNHFGR